MTKKSNSMFVSTAQEARRTALHIHDAEVNDLVAKVKAASKKGDLTITVPRMHDAVKEILEVEHELKVKLVADYDTNPATLNHKISW